ncbi:hypothetical protein M3P05_12685 [Sansalvadorimonas sp. 2012CJ34-2]|uniref:SWIM-type domain-containing protein n=1 Tax=Parendozoicomonas callyspongiae TaxID=2942213 RepID=A0ABT0PHC6_9GAMM|nr:hypothetical protein [Sansalvadorimonas sp. 2012CJ34-2]MCL6270780.1 hypothetical protein [Sansalvadorimonas sp. 2012CJ34-2]
MNDKPDITDHLLTRLAGEGAFERGEDYYHGNTVGELRQKGDAILADVKGGETWHVQLTYTQRGLEGFCDCPASEKVDFCKHCVATAMALRDQLKEPVTKKAGAKAADIIPAYLNRQSKDYLVKNLTEVILDDKLLRQAWLIRAESALGGLNKATIKKRITAAIPYNRNYYRYDQVRTYFAGVEQALEALKEPISERPEEEQLELLDYAIERIIKAQETVDDSGGFRFDSVAMIQSMYRQAFRGIPWTNEHKVNHLIDLMIQDEYSMYGEIPTDYDDVISPDCMALFFQTVQTRWDALPDMETDGWNIGREYYHLQRVLEAIASKQNDYETLITINQKVARGAYTYVKMAGWSLKLEKYDQAQGFLDQAKKDPHYRHSGDAHTIRQQILLNTGRVELALDEQWDQFKSSMSREDWKSLKKLADLAKSDRNWFSEATEWLQLLQQEVTNNYRYLPGTSAVDALMAVYLEEQQADMAWNLMNTGEVSTGHLSELADQLKGDVGRYTAIQVRLAKNYINKTNNSSYKEAIKLLRSLDGYLKQLSHNEDMLPILQKMRTDFRQKRNFIKWLNEAFPI